MKIEINKPCHENWDAMTPNEKGAFCKVCTKNVIDFSKQTLDEIKDFFSSLPKSNKVCGRFKESQLNELSFEHFANQFVGWKLLNKMAVVMFFVFGMSLFGQAQNPQTKNVMVKGEVAYIPKDTTKTKATPTKTVTPKPEDHHIMGGPRFVPDKPKEEPKKLMGKPAVIRDPKEKR